MCRSKRAGLWMLMMMYVGSTGILPRDEDHSVTVKIVRPLLPGTVLNDLSYDTHNAIDNIAPAFVPWTYCARI